MKIRAEDELKILKNKLDITKTEKEIQVDSLSKQNEILKTAIRKAVNQIHTLKYENDVLNRKIKIAEDWVGQLKEVDLL
jgi:regulator of replication initiation timing